MENIAVQNSLGPRCTILPSTPDLCKQHDEESLFLDSLFHEDSTRKPTAKEWAPHRERMKQLYLVDNLSLNDTRLIMKVRYHFDASNRQYKYQFEKWYFKKILTPGEKDFIVQLKQQRKAVEHKKTTFLLSGRVVDDSKLARSAKSSSTINAEDSCSSSSRPYLDFYTPPPSPQTSLEQHHNSSYDLNPDAQLHSPLQQFCVTCNICERDVYGDAPRIIALFQKHLEVEHEDHAYSNYSLHLYYCPPSKTPCNIDLIQNCGHSNSNGQAGFEDSVRKLISRNECVRHCSVIEEVRGRYYYWICASGNQGPIAKIGYLTLCTPKTSRNVLHELMKEAEQYSSSQHSSSQQAGPRTTIPLTAPATIRSGSDLPARLSSHGLSSDSKVASGAGSHQRSGLIEPSDRLGDRDATVGRLESVIESLQQYSTTQTQATAPRVELDADTASQSGATPAYSLSARYKQDTPRASNSFTRSVYHRTYEERKEYMDAYFYLDNNLYHILRYNGTSYSSFHVVKDATTFLARVHDTIYRIPESKENEYQRGLQQPSGTNGLDGIDIDKISKSFRESGSNFHANETNKDDDLRPGEEFISKAASLNRLSSVDVEEILKNFREEGGNFYTEETDEDEDLRLVEQFIIKPDSSSVSNGTPAKDIVLAANFALGREELEECIARWSS